MKKNALAILLSLALTVSLAACGGDDRPPADAIPGVEDPVSPEDGGDGMDGTTDTPVDAPEGEDETGETDPAAGAAGDSAAPEPAERPENDAPVVGSRPADTAQKPQTDNRPADPAVKPEGEPVAPPQSPAEPAPVDLTAFYDTLAAGTNWPSMVRAEGETLDALYPGLSGISTEQCGVYMTMITAAVGETALVEVENADDVQTVKDIFQARIDDQVGTDGNPGGAWYPASVEGWKNNSRIVSNGNYVMMVVCEDADAVVESFNALFA